MLPRGGVFEQLGKPRAEEDVVPQNQRDRIPADKLAAEDEGLRQPFRLRLLDIAELEAKLRAVA